jgi:hypothetical protein
MKIILLVLIIILICQISKSQNMENYYAKRISKKEVKAYIQSGEVIYDSTQSPTDYSKRYDFLDGRILYVRPDGIGSMWDSQSQIDKLDEIVDKEIIVLNLTDWILINTDLDSLEKKSIEVLEKYTCKSIDYSVESLKCVNRIKIKDVVIEKELLYSIIYYSCKYYVYNFGGEIEKESILTEIYLRPIVKFKNGRIFRPYMEFLLSFSEPPQISIKESIELEKTSYMFFKD